MEWYIGQDIVAIVDHHQGVFKKGDVFTIKGLQTSKCKCNKIDIDIGFEKMHDNLRCTICNNKWVNTTNSSWWFDENRFVPLDSLVNIEEIENLIKQEIEI